MSVVTKGDRIAVRRSARAAGVSYVNGWLIERQPNTFATEFAWLATAVDASGFQTAKRGFQRKRDAVAFAEGVGVPSVDLPMRVADDLSNSEHDALQPFGAMRVGGAAKV